MSAAGWGFVKGFTGQALSDIDARKKAEMEMKKVEMLERLRMETAKEMALFEEDLPSKKLAREATEQGMALADRKAELDERKFSLDETTTNSTLAMNQERLALDRQDNARADRVATAQIGAYNRRSLDEESTTPDGKKILIAEYSRTMEELQEAGLPPSMLANFQTKWYEGINKDGWTPAQQREFLMTMRRVSTDAQYVDNKGNTRPGLLYGYNAANAQLEKKTGGLK